MDNLKPIVTHEKLMKPSTPFIFCKAIKSPKPHNSYITFKCPLISCNLIVGEIKMDLGFF